MLSQRLRSLFGETTKAGEPRQPKRVAGLGWIEMDRRKASNASHTMVNGRSLIEALREILS